jgi:hypothetical protein
VCVITLHRPYKILVPTNAHVILIHIGTKRLSSFTMQGENNMKLTGLFVLMQKTFPFLRSMQEGTLTTGMETYSFRV